jgi:T5SS/PEP-CTERM-associated repeat protein
MTMATRTWITFGSGSFNDPDNWFPAGIPTDSDFVSFEVGAGLTYTVTFPGNPVGNAVASYATSHLRLRADTVTFSGSTEVNRDHATYTVASSTMSEQDRGIIIGVLSADTAVLNISPANPSGLSLVSFRCTAATIGEAVDSTGTLNVSIGAFSVTGSDSTQTQLIVGNHGTGTLTITNGAELNVLGFNSRVTLGNNATAAGSLTVSDAGSTWTNGNELWVGGSGSGTLIIQNGGRLRCASNAGFSNVIGVFPGASGAATVDGPGSTWTYGNELVVGNGGDGTLTITNGGSLINNVSGSTSVGSDGSGTATVTGPGSTWNTNGPLNIGSTGTGALAVLDGGSLASGSSKIRGLNAGSGHVLVADADSIWTVNGSLTIGEPEAGFGTGPTQLTINPGGTVSVTQNIDLYTNSLLELHGGTLSADEIGGHQINGQFDWTSGTLHVKTFHKSLLNQGGKFAPRLSAGATVIDGNYTQQAGAELEIEIGGPVSGTQYDFVGIEGVALLDGVLRLTLIDNFIPTPTQTFTVFASFGITGTFSNAPDGQRLATTDGLGSFVVNYEPADEEDRHHITLTDFASSAPANVDDAL